jgi:hypothetical protein
MQNDLENREKKETNRDTEQSEDAPSLVAQSVADNKTGERQGASLGKDRAVANSRAD